MTGSQRVVILVLAIVAVLACTVISLGLLAKRRGQPLSPRARRFVAASFSLFTLGVSCFGYALFIEADWLEVTRVTVETAKWPTNRKLRIAHISDLHVDRESRALTRLGTIIAQEKVDLVVFTGDSINEAESAPLLRSILGGLPARVGRVAVRGNHDVYRWPKIDLFGGGVATELMSDAPLLLENGTLAVCGAPFGGYDGILDCLDKSPKDAFVLFAYHSPDLVEQIQADLYLAGHTHGGQVALPFFGALITMSRYDKRYEAGRYQVGNTTLYVNRGIGFEPHFFRVRFFARPELTLIDVVGTR